MRISDWSSDVCSSDLSPGGRRLISIPRFARDMLALLDALGIERCLLVGHSMGGAIAQQLTLDQRSEERRVGKECVSTCRSRWSAYHYKNKNIKNKQNE